MRRATVAALLLLGAPGCDTEKVDVPTWQYRTCAAAEKVGEFRVELSESYTAVSGGVAGGVVPGDVPQVTHTAGDCRLLRRRNLLCDPACESETTCGEAGRCIPYPTPLSAGTVTIKGLAKSVSMMPSQHGRRYNETTLPHPGFLPGAIIELGASGAEVPAFSLAGRGVAALELEGGAPVFQPGQGFELRWKASAGSPARVTFEIQIDQHGVTRASLVCDVPDNGAARVDAALVDELVSAGTSGFPKVMASRRTADAAKVTQGCVELLVLAATERPLKVPGHDPCRSDRDCPTGKTCAIAIQTCK